MDAEDLLAEIEAGRYAGEGAMAMLTLAVAEINRDLTADGDRERVRRVVAQLHRAAGDVARRSGARGFSISAGFPSGVSVRVDWDV